MASPSISVGAILVVMFRRHLAEISRWWVTLALRTGRHHGSTTMESGLDAVAPMGREGGRREGFPRRMTAAHTNPSLVPVVPLFLTPLSCESDRRISLVSGWMDHHHHHHITISLSPLPLSPSSLPPLSSLPPPLLPPPFPTLLLPSHHCVVLGGRLQSQPEGRSATFKVQGIGLFSLFLIF